METKLPLEALDIEQASQDCASHILRHDITRVDLAHVLKAAVIENVVTICYKTKIKTWNSVVSGTALPEGGNAQAVKRSAGCCCHIC